jgi:hypothetical protein
MREVTTLPRNSYELRSHYFLYGPQMYGARLFDLRIIHSHAGRKSSRQSPNLTVRKSKLYRILYLPQNSSALIMASQELDNLDGYLPAFCCRYVRLAHLVRPLVVAAPSLDERSKVFAAVLSLHLIYVSYLTAGLETHYDIVVRLAAYAYLL